jgi:hypothetical protein
MSCPPSILLGMDVAEFVVAAAISASWLAGNQAVDTANTIQPMFSSETMEKHERRGVYRRRGRSCPGAGVQYTPCQFAFPITAMKAASSCSAIRTTCLFSG